MTPDARGEGRIMQGTILVCRAHGMGCMTGRFADRDPWVPLAALEAAEKELAKCQNGLWLEIERREAAEKLVKDVDQSVAERTRIMAEELLAAQARADRLHKDRYDLLSLKTKDGMSAAEWQMRTATAEGKVRNAQAEAARLRKFVAFFRRCFDNWIESDCLAFLDGSDFQEWGEEAGLLASVTYDPDKHGEIEDAEPGDRIYTLSDDAKAALAAEKEKP
jgi:hypothetical protein